MSADAKLTATDATASRPTRRERLQVLWSMTPQERATAMYAGRLSLEQCCAWAARHPDEVPLLNGEFWFIAAFEPEAIEAAS